MKKYKSAKHYIIRKDGVRQRYAFKPSNWKAKKKDYSYSKKKRAFLREEINDKIFRYSVVYNFDSHVDQTDLTPKANRGEYRCYIYSETPLDTTEKYMIATLSNLSYPFLGLGKHGKTKLTIGKERNKVVSRSEMKSNERLNYCYKYARFKVPSMKEEAEMTNSQIEDSYSRKERFVLTRYGFILMRSKLQ